MPKTSQINRLFLEGEQGGWQKKPLTSTSRLLAYYWPRRESKSLPYKSKTSHFTGRSGTGEGRPPPDRNPSLPSARRALPALLPSLPRAPNGWWRRRVKGGRGRRALRGAADRAARGCGRSPAPLCRWQVFVNTAGPWAASGARPRCLLWGKKHQRKAEVKAWSSSKSDTTEGFLKAATALLNLSKNAKRPLLCSLALCDVSSLLNK